jgi:arsenate reductase
MAGYCFYVMNKITVYGISSCDNTRKAMDWYRKNKGPVIFHDYREQGISAEKLEEWCRKAGWQVLLNKKSTSWRMLSPATQQSVVDAGSATRLMISNPVLIKRPVVESNNELIVGLDKTYFSKP